MDLKDIANLEESQAGKDNARTVNQDQMPASAPSVAPKGTKKVFSRPLDTPLKTKPGKTQLDTMLVSLGTEYDYQNSAPELSQVNSEEARKRLRIARLKKEGIAKQHTSIKPSLLNDTGVSEWEKEQTLKQIEMVREMKKA